MLRALLAFVLLSLVVATGGYWWATMRPLPLPRSPYELNVRSGSTLRMVARDLRADGVIPAAWPLVALGRATRAERAIKAGNYELESGLTLVTLLERLTQGDVSETGLTIVEGSTFRELKEALRANPEIVKIVTDLPDAEIMQKIGAKERLPEGLFFPDTYFFATGTSDSKILARAYRTMQERLEAAWARRAPDLPLATPYEALILASIVEKETGAASDRPVVASVFYNRLRERMRLQTDPSVIYGLGAEFDGNLTRRHLDTDREYNTYTREGLPPTPIAAPGQAAIDAVLHPATTPYLYFVARGDGKSVFSATLAEHNRAVAKYQKSGR